MKVGWGPLLVVGLALGLAVAAPAAGDSIGARKATVDGRIADLRSHIGAAQQNEGVLTSQLSEVTRELRASQSAVDEAESTLAGLEAELGNQRARLDVLSSGLKVQTERLQRLRSEYARPLTVLETRLQGIYKSESPDMLSFLVSATSFGELVDNYRMLSRIGRQDQLVALDVRAAKSRAAAAHRATTVTRQETLRTVRRIADRTDEARVARDHLVAGRNSLAAARKLKASSLADVRETRASTSQR
jgi:peptidoglycan hydrolase CwlO-like protein